MSDSFVAEDPVTGQPSPEGQFSLASLETPAKNAGRPVPTATAPATSVPPQAQGQPAASPGPQPLSPNLTVIAGGSTPTMPALPAKNPDGSAPTDALLNNPYQKQIMAWKQADPTLTDADINAGLSKLLQPQIDAWQAAGATPDDIGKGVANLLGYSGGDVVMSYPHLIDNAPTQKPLNTLDEAAAQITTYGGLVELINGAPPKPEIQPTDLPGTIAQAAGQVAQSTPGSVAASITGGGVGGFLGAFGGPLDFVTIPAGAYIGSNAFDFAYNYLDALVRITYADASAKGVTTRPDFADNLAQHATDALKQTAPMVPAMLIGGPLGAQGEKMAAKLGAAGIAKAAIKWGTRGTGELVAMQAASDAIAGQLEPWQQVVSNAVVLVGMHVAVGTGTKVFDVTRNAVSHTDGSKLDQMTPSDAAKALLQNTAATNEPSSAVIARASGTTFQPLTAAAKTKGVTVDPAIETEFSKPGGALDYGPMTRTGWFNSAVTDGVAKANDYLAKSGGNPDVFKQNWIADHQADFKIDPAKYGGNLESFQSRFDAEPPASPEMVKAALTRINDKAGKVVPPSVDIPASLPITGGLLRAPIRTFRTIFNPGAVDGPSGDASALIRTMKGLSTRATEQTQAAVKTSGARRVVAGMKDVLPLLDHIEGRYGDTGVEPAPAFGKDQPVADMLRAKVQARRDAMKALPGSAPGVEEAYPSLFKDPEAARAFLKGRDPKDPWPTIGEGIRSGLEPTSDPVSAVLAWTSHVDTAIAHAGIRDVATAAGHWVYADKGKQPDGWVALKGPLQTKVNTKGAVVSAKTGVPMVTPDQQAYAPEGFARVYNNFVGKGFGEFGPEIENIQKSVQRASNAISSLKLALSFYHAIVIAKASVTNGMAQGIDELTSGHPIMALKTFALSPAQPLTGIFQGLNAQHVYLGQRVGTDMDQRAVDFITEANGRMGGGKGNVGVDQNISKVGSLVTALIQGTYGAQIKREGQMIAQQPLVGTAKVAAEQVGQILQTIGQPLFEKYIPWVKNAATMNHVASWLKRNPEATHAEALTATREVVDRMDDRFGEMVQDNIFVNKFAKQIASAALLSYSWFTGEDIRTIGGGAYDFLKAGGKIATAQKPQWTMKMSYLVASGITTAVTGAIITYMLTGQWPKDAQDAFAPRTGGTDSNGNPERLQVPGPEKDIWETLANGIPGEISNKLSPAYSTALGLWSNKDWKGDPIAAWNVPTDSGLPGTGNMAIMGELAQYIFSNAGVPISLSQPHPQGSNINPIESLLGFRQPTPLLRDPATFVQNQGYFAEKAWAAKVKADNRAAAKDQP